MKTLHTSLTNETTTALKAVSVMLTSKSVYTEPVYFNNWSVEIEVAVDCHGKAFIVGYRAFHIHDSRVLAAYGNQMSQDEFISWVIEEDKN